MASHDVFRVRETCDKIGILKNGKLIKEMYSKDVTSKQLENIYLEYMKINEKYLFQRVERSLRNKILVFILCFFVLILSLVTYFGVLQNTKQIQTQKDARVHIRKQWDELDRIIHTLQRIMGPMLLNLILI